MKKQLLSFLFGAAALTVSAQLNNAGDGFTLTNSDWQSNCYGNSNPSNAGIMSYGNTITEGPSYILDANGPYVLISADPADAVKSATWFGIPSITGDGDAATCNNLYGASLGIDMSSNGQVTLTAEASEVGAVLEFYLGSGGQWSPTTSTFWTGDAEIIVSHTFTSANNQETFTLDLASANPTGWSGWSGNSNIQSMGFKSNTTSATFKVYEIKFGADADSDSNDGGDTGDNGGGNDETNGEACASTTDDGQAEATFYNLIADGLSTTVTCQYDVLRDVKGTKYGALETATLQGESPAKYCGMCVEMTGAKGTDIVRVVDECPDCWEHNSGDTDIDLSPSAFEAIVGEESIGRSSITWKEVSCPWSTPISLMIESGHQWSIQLIVENEVNRIASVDISSDGGSNWDAMERTVANQWSRGSMSGETKDFRITDIYGSVITMSGLDFSTTLSWDRFDGTENFPACGLVSSEQIQNDLDFVNIFPNPANTSITFEGMKEAISIEIVNINGKVVASKILNNQYAQVSLDVSGLANGLYVAKMNGSYGFSTKTFVKK